MAKAAPGRRRRRLRTLRYEDRILVAALAAGLAGTALGLGLLWTGGASTATRWSVTVLVCLLWLGFAFSARSRISYSLGTLANLLEALRREDFSIRGRPGPRADAWDTVLVEVNLLAETLREQRLGAVEAAALLRKVMSEIDVAVFTFDPAGRLKLVNRSAERLLAQPSERLLGRNAEELGLDELLGGEVERTVEKTFPGRTGRWGIRRSTFREAGLPHHLLVISDLSRTLREEERQAWQRLIRVLGHELNNSLAPIRSMAATLRTVLAKRPRPHDWEEDAERGLTVIEERAQGLSRFMASYAQLAQLPPPRLEPLRVAELARRVATLETRLPVEIEAGPDLLLEGDAGQLEQLLINLVRNAVDAVRETGGRVRLGWRIQRGDLEIFVDDEGPGLASTANLFVPFFTTKPKGTGIGLVLSRQIAEAHGGTLVLRNRRRGRGCEARLRLPLGRHAAGSPATIGAARSGRRALGRAPRP